MTRPHHQAVYVISVAAELAGMHPQTLRIYERRGLLTPARTTGGNRRYSDADIMRLRRIAELASTGMNLEGIRHVMSLEEEVVRLRTEVAELRQGLIDAVNALEQRSSGALVPLRRAVTLYNDRPSIFDPHR
jgi:MerR family transcriptional regulator/heat shock protein HspR